MLHQLNLICRCLLLHFLYTQRSLLACANTSFSHSMCPFYIMPTCPKGGLLSIIANLIFKNFKKPKLFVYIKGVFFLV